ncbi:MAG TPA: sensor histidine kinase [Asanoa sp.]
MDAILPLPRRRGLPPAAPVALAWFGAVGFLATVTLAILSRDDVITNVLPVAGTVLLLGLFRRLAWAATALLLAASVAVVTTASSPQVGYAQLVLVGLVVCVLAATRPLRVSLIAAVAALVTQMACTPFYTSGNRSFVDALTYVVLGMVAVWSLGFVIGQRRRYAAALRAQAAAQAVTDERLRIARELHDLIAHSVGVIAIQAGVGSRVMDTQPNEARAALTTIESTSRQTLAELRRTLGALRRSDPAPLVPRPGLANVDRLIATTRDAGIHVDVRHVGDRRSLPADVDLSAYRIVQEALTNVVRHARVSSCALTLHYRADDLTIEAIDDGRGPAEPGAGYGIVGMRERVALLGGDLVAGPRPEGGFRVVARLPLPTGDPP